MPRTSLISLMSYTGPSGIRYGYFCPAYQGFSAPLEEMRSWFGSMKSASESVMMSASFSGISSLTRRSWNTCLRYGT